MAEKQKVIFVDGDSTEEVELEGTWEFEGVTYAWSARLHDEDRFAVVEPPIKEGGEPTYNEATWKACTDQMKCAAVYECTTPGTEINVTHGGTQYLVGRYVIDRRNGRIYGDVVTCPWERGEEMQECALLEQAGEEFTVVEMNANVTEMVSNALDALDWYPDHHDPAPAATEAPRGEADAGVEREEETLP